MFETKELATYSVVNWFPKTAVLFEHQPSESHVVPGMRLFFYDEARWPEGVELRDWAFYNNNSR